MLNYALHWGLPYYSGVIFVSSVFLRVMTCGPGIAISVGYVIASCTECGKGHSFYGQNVVDAIGIQCNRNPALRISLQTD